MGAAEVRRLTAQIEGILDNFSRPLARLEDEVTAALGELAVRIAGSLVGRAYDADPVLLSDLVAEALDAVGGASREVEVRLHPDDIQSLAPLLALVSGARPGPRPDPRAAATCACMPRACASTAPSRRACAARWKT